MDRISHKVVIVGGGPAGVFCAKVLYARGIDYVLVDPLSPGGALLVDYDFQFLGERHNSLQYAAKICDFPVRRLAVTIGNISRDGEKWLLATDEQAIECDYLVLATGVEPRTGGYEESDRMIIGPFKRAYRFPYATKSVAVLGGGDNAFEYAAIAMERGATEVTIFAKAIRATSEYVEKVKHLGVRVVIESHVQVVDDGSGIHVQHQEFDVCLAMYGFSARPLQISSNPLRTGKHSRFITDRDSAMRIFAIGDCVVGEMSIARAVTSGAECGTLIADELAAADSELDESTWRVTCEMLAGQAAKRSGLSHGYYVDIFSAGIDAAVMALSDKHRFKALSIANEWDYASPVEREEEQKWNAENGFCSHGIELGACPAGCGSGPDD